MQLLAAEAQYGCAFADSDPLKLYYGVAQASIGELTDDVVTEGWRLARLAIQERLFGFADYVVYVSASAASLSARELADTTRRRSGFAWHVQLAPAMAAYYRALEAVRPGTVQWFDTEGAGRPALVTLANTLPLPVYDRYDIAAFDQLQTKLGVAR